MTFGLLKLALIASVAQQAQSGPVLTLDEAVRIAARNSFTVRLAQNNLDRAQDLIRQAETANGLRLNVTGTYSRYDRPPPSFGGPSHIDSKVIQTQLSANVDLAGANRKFISASRFNAEAAAASLIAEMSTIRQTVETYYFAVLQSEWQVTVQQEALATAQRRLRDTQLRFNQGLIARFDVIRLETDVTRAQTGLATAQNTVIQAKQNLNNVLARPIDTPFEPESFGQTTAPVPDANALVAEAMTRRPEVLAAEKRLQSLRKTTEGEKLGLAPSLNVGITNTTTINPTQFQRDNQPQAFAQVTIPIWDAGVTKARVALARRDEQQAQIQLEQTRVLVDLQVRSAIVRIANAQQQIEAANKTIEQETEALRVAELRYQAGNGILLDVTTAQENLTRARSDLARARYEYLTAYADLEKAVGRTQLSPVSPVMQPGTGGPTPVEGSKG